jgi:hypothetical protein
VDLDLSRTKRVILDGGEIVLAPWEDRRPEAYRL